MKRSTTKTTHSVLIFWIAAGWVGYCLLPWYMVEDGFWSLHWLVDGYPFDDDYAPAAFLVAQGKKLWLAPMLLALALPLLALGRPKSDPLHARILILSGASGFAWLIAQGFGIGIRGFNFDWLTALFGELGDRQFGMGYGAMICASSFLFLLTQGIAARGAVNGDVFVVSAIGGVITIVTAFVFFPIARMLFAAFVTEDGAYSVAVFFSKFFDDRLWGLGCLWGAKCGAAWNSLVLAVLVGLLTTALGLCFALVVTRSGFRYKRALRALTVLPIITPPFVIGLALILLFGLSGSVTRFVADLLGTQPTRWLYGMPGILIAQTLAFTPIAFLVLIGVVEGVSPSMEEAAQTLRANRWQTFRTVSLPLMRPGLANAFLLGFIESMADFGNPLVLGGNFDVLSTEIFFAIVGAQYDQGRAAVLAMVLLFFTLSAFYAQRVWLGKKSYTTVTGKGDSGVHPLMPTGLSIPVAVIALGWALFTVVVYAMIVYGSVVELWGGQQHADPQALRHRLFGAAGCGRHPLDRRRLGQFLDHHHHRRHRRPADRRRGSGDGLSSDPAEFRGQERLRIRHHAVLCHSRHGDRRQLYSGVQRTPDRDHGNRRHPGGQLHLSQHARGCARRHRQHVTAGPQPGRILADAGGEFLADLPAGHPAAAAAGDPGRAGLQLRPRDDRHLGRDLPGQRRI
ncbi:Binding-protein-dependent transport system inner membrane component [Ruegeria intermedia]|uniref:Binding-protein-dependent transport system inner membrane component n=1 Tax=Ruegeria intermedia TaxID=996115 RepID=A0A1M5A8L5_9RHOB|nr:Binding-protein-dependent transport system inner membrane component [Ruegeria intermedia]